MSKFKVGDRVKRLTGSYGGMSVGDTSVVTEITTTNGVQLKDFRGIAHDVSNLEILTYLDKEKGMKQFTKDDLKDGDKIYIADKDIDYPQLPFYVGGEQAIRLDFSKRASHIELSDMSSDFITRHGRKVAKIVRDGTVLFERHPEKRKVTFELTEEQERELRKQLGQ